MEEVFYYSPNDTSLSIHFKREANIVLASLDKESDMYAYKKEHLEKTLSVIRAIEYTKPKNRLDVDFILNAVNHVWNVGILSPLTLRENEFLDYKDSKGYFRNVRYKDIYMDANHNMAICNDNAFNLYVKTAYSHKDKEQIEYASIVVPRNHRVYLHKGGVVTGEYIEKCIIRPDVVNRHSFTIQSVLNIPVAIILDREEDTNVDIYVIDHRNNKLDALRQFYYVPVDMDEIVANRHYNLRKYQKL